MILALVREVPVQIPDEPASLFGYSFLEQYPSILPSLANRTPLSTIRVQISWNLLSFDWQCSAERSLLWQRVFKGCATVASFNRAPIARRCPGSILWLVGLGYDSRLVREVPVQIPDEPASLFGYSFLEQYPSILPSLANRTPLSKGSRETFLDSILILAGQLLFSVPPSEFYTAKRREDDPVSAWFHGVTVSTLDSESSDPSSNLGGTCWFLTGSAQQRGAFSVAACLQRVFYSALF
ncbi:hypothetical protein G5714_011596 [Onychostoma macrolepis]|uniref:Uncharacterized protein n=1 Tax=Onychostoma macrolepis TaxID=369639 RepID=A0A7J6CN85_9TELE|nr:hypothetical protein G5714_011596 [Onychostoma macrolepis]